jgi:hypothetical protein
MKDLKPSRRMYALESSLEIRPVNSELKINTNMAERSRRF